jgi:hypothetical protein
MRENIIVRLIAYYLAVITCLSGLFYLLPVLGDYVAMERARQGARASLELHDLSASAPAAFGPEGPAPLLDPSTSVPILLSLVFALLVALPVVWVYRWTRPR